MSGSASASTAHIGAAGGGVVAIGGGHGLARALEALRLLGHRPTAVVTVADDGGSSGRLRRDLGIIAPGDLRMTLLTLATRRDLADVLAHRFARGELEGHALGNLLLVALAERAGGDFVAALDAAADLLGCAGRVLPSTTASVQMKASVEGEEVSGQVRVATAPGRIERLWLEPERPPACADAVAAIEHADLVVLGPGSLYTSVIANLLVPGVRDALARSAAQRVVILNLRTQPGETSGMDAAEHVQALLAHVEGLVLDAVIVHEDGGRPGPLGTVREGAQVRRVVAAALADDLAAGHDPARLARALAEVTDDVR